jgi:hypothetical protein
MMGHTINLFGSNVLDKYFISMQKFSPSQQQFERALRVDHLLGNIGNLWVLPGKVCDTETMARYKDCYKFHHYMDRYLQAMYAIFMDDNRTNTTLKGLFYKNRKVMTQYQGAEGWTRFTSNMMLQDYLDADGKPKEIFDFVWGHKKFLDRETYFRAVDKFCTFYEKAIPKRADHIISVLKSILSKE